jgi:DNA-directed RNA polymerase delta subunit
MPFNFAPHLLSYPRQHYLNLGETYFISLTSGMTTTAHYLLGRILKIMNYIEGRLMSIEKVIYQILTEEKRPLHYVEITRLVLTRMKLKSKTPEKSVATSLTRSTKFKRVAEGIYGLRSWKKYPEARFAKDIAYDILRKKGEPMNITELGEEILRIRKYKGSATLIVNQATRKDSRFFHEPATRKIGLTEWLDEEKRPFENQ